MAWIAQLAMFLVLGLLVFPSSFADIALEGTVLALVLALRCASAGGVRRDHRPVRRRRPRRARLGRPARSGAGRARDLPGDRGHPRQPRVLQHRLLRGAAVDVRAGRDDRAGRAPAESDDQEPAAPSPRARSRRPARSASSAPTRSRSRPAPDDALVGHRIRDLGLPRAAIVNVIVRDGQAIPPRGSTRIEAGDRLHVLIRREEMGAMDALLERWREGPLGPPPRQARIPEGHAPVFSVRRWTALRRRPVAPRAGLRPRRRRPPAHAPRRARRARAAGGRLHRGDGARCSRSAGSSC